MGKDKYKLDSYSNLNYKVIASGSSGNSVMIEDVLIDCGTAYSKLKPYLSRVRVLIITHTHTDHLKVNTYNKIRSMYPRIVCIGNYEVAQKVSVDLIAQVAYPNKVRDREFYAVEVPHDVLTYAYAWKQDGEWVMYCTDASDTKALESLVKGRKIKYFFLESNHDEKKVEAIRGESVKRYGYNAYAGAKRHLSTQQAKAFYYMNREDNDSLWVELHKSSRFY